MPQPLRPRSTRYAALAQYYDAEYEHLPMLQVDVPFYLDQLPRRPQHILELACGTGRAAIPLAQAGHRVVGVDVATDMLVLARQKRDAVGLNDRQLHFARGDILRLNLERTFDHAAIFFNTFLNFTTAERQDALLRTARAHLKSGGRLYIDIFYPNLELLSASEANDLDPVMFYVPSLDRTVHRTTDVKRGTSPQLQHITFKYNWFDAHGVRHDERVTFDLTYMFPRELNRLLEANGFSVEEQVGDYDGSAVDCDSTRIITWARAG